jgi:mRNA interferase MazF
MGEYIKDFDKWNAVKKTANNRILPEEFFFLEREIWWASLGVNIGEEIDGKNENFERPVLVLKKLSESSFWALPITSTDKSGTYFYKTTCRGKEITISLHQIRFVSINRLLRIHARLDERTFQTVRDRLIDIMCTKEITPSAESDFGPLRKHKDMISEWN